MWTCTSLSKSATIYPRSFELPFVSAVMWVGVRAFRRSRDVGLPYPTIPDILHQEKESLIGKMIGLLIRFDSIVIAVIPEARIWILFSPLTFSSIRSYTAPIPCSNDWSMSGKWNSLPSIWEFESIEHSRNASKRTSLTTRNSQSAVRVCGKGSDNSQVVTKNPG